MLRVCQFSIVHYVERNLLLLVASASDLPLRINKFCSLLFSSSWSSMLVVINKDSLMRGCLCGKLHWRWTVVRVVCTAAVFDPIARYSSRIAICAYPTCIRRPLPLARSPSEYCSDVWYENLEWFGYPTVKRIWRYDYSFWRNSRTSQTDRQLSQPHDGIGRACIVSPGKN